MKVKDLTGQKFNKLTVLHQVERNSKGKIQWLCECECGKLVKVTTSNLKSGHTKSCGCYVIENNKKLFTKHGRSHERIYHIWNTMIKRTKGKTEKTKKTYKNRGITVCEEWLHDFQAFYDWSMANGYADDLTIDRINNDGNYEPGNCRWVTSKVQGNNRRNNKVLEFNGEIHTIAEWAEIIGTSRSTLWKRLNKGWSIEKALSTPIGNRRKSYERYEIR